MNRGDNLNEADGTWRGRIALSAAGIAVCLGWLVAGGIAVGETRPAVSFDRDIRPILSDKCFRCHGPDAGARQADMRLDVRDAIPEHVVVPGKPDESELVARIMSEDEDVRMPPPDSRLALSAEQKELLRRWIDEGAPYTEHWSFVSLPAQMVVPEVSDGQWPQQVLDRFVLARLEAEQLRPAPRTNPLRLLRRVTLDLTGLPPTVEECRDFEEAAAPDLETALTQAVDRLLASPAYGEHMAVGWLDAARYADSYGYQSDQLNSQWPYRDWVVRALNANMPFDQFLTWQLAGDLLPPSESSGQATRDQILATAFNRLHRLTNEGGSIAEEWLVENAADRVQTMGTAILGLTLECARCHDHKYDPITQHDFYSLFAFFNSIDENGMYDFPTKIPSPTLLLPTDEQESRLNAAREKISAVETELAKSVEEGDGRFEKWLEKSQTTNDVDLIGYFSFDGKLDQVANEATKKENQGQGPGLKSVTGVRGQAVRFDGDRGVVFPGFFTVDRSDTFSLDFWLRDNARHPLPAVVLQRTFGSDVGFNGFDLTLSYGIVEARMYRIWPGNGIGVRAKESISRGEWRHLAVTYDGSSRAAGLRLFLDGREMPTTTLRDRIHKSAATKAYSDGHFTLGQRFRDRGFQDGELDELRVYDRALTPLEIRHLHDGKSLKTARDGVRRPTPGEELREYYFSAVDPQSRQLAQQLRKAHKKFVDVEEEIQEITVMQELATPRPAHVLARGAYDAPKSDANRVERDTFENILIPFPADAPRDRLGLARWLTDPRHPLTARVFVNRVWANFFGRPLVATPENFGRQGAMPTHPELLDWLARDSVEHGWDIKRLCRQIVLSATYQQDSRCGPELRKRDPENELLARGPSRRLSAEQIRDVALAASGLLERKIGGPPVSPYQPGEDLWTETNNMSPPYRQSTGKDLYRRSLYSVWKRTTPLPNMLTFDAPTREVCTVSRSRTNTPLQALVLLNDVQFVEAARVLATTVSREHTEVDERIREAFLLLTGRRPDSRELELLVSMYNDQRRLFADVARQDAFKFIQLGEAKPDPTLVPASLAALTVTCQAILNLDATIYER